MSPLRATASLPVPVAPDADWDALRAAALLAVQEQQAQALEPWTDHNLHDPGITLLEAALWALADLHYRTANRSWDSWSVEVAPWRGVDLARGHDRQLARTALAAPAPLEQLLAFVDSRARAIVELTSTTGSAAAAAAVVRLLREPTLLRAALDGGAAVADAVASAPGPTAAAAAVAAALDGLGLWPEEVDALVRREARRGFARQLGAQQALIVQTLEATPSSHGASLVTALETLLDVDPAEALVALALDPAPRVDPEIWETADGETTLWPPHPLQALTCEPVTPTDYRRLLLADEDVARAWVLPGLAAGVRWDNTVSTQAFPWRQGAFTLLVEPVTAPADVNAFLRGMLDVVLGTERTHPTFDLRTDAVEPRRLLCDELCAAIVGRCPVVVCGTLELAPTASTEDALAEARSRLALFLSADRIAPFEPPPAPGPALVAPRDLDGPWPRAEDVVRYAADPGRETREDGWQPGVPVRVTEVIQLLQTIPGVLGIDGLRLQREGDVGWEDETLELDPYCVPAFAGDCLCTRIVDPRECGG